MVSVTIEVSDKDIAYLLSSAFEGGATGNWCRIMDHKLPTAPKPFMEEGGQDPKVWPNYDYPLTEDGAVVCRRDDEGTDKKYKPLVLDRAAIERGLKIMATKYPRHFSDFLIENYDMFTGDVFVQCCLLGSVEYG